MDGQRFDGISLLLAGAGTRRGALKATLWLLAGGGALAVGEASARPALCRPAGRYCTNNRQCCNSKCRTGKRVPIASRNMCDCDAPYAMCGKTCRDLSSDPNHCGECGHKIYPEAEICCDGVPTLIDENNCHACGEVCGPDDICCGPEIGCAASCEPEEPPVTCTDPGACTIAAGQQSCAVRVQDCETRSAACIYYLGQNGIPVPPGQVGQACATSEDCSPAFTAFPRSASSSAECVFGIDSGTGWSTSSGGACAIVETVGTFC